MRIPGEEIAKSNAAIEQALGESNLIDRGIVARNSLAHMRHLTEHVLVYAMFRDEVPCKNYYDAIQESLDRAKRDRWLRPIWDFHFNLEKVISHYTPSESSSIRLLLRYFESLYLLRKYAGEKLGISILRNLELFPIEIDEDLQGYYRVIAEKLEMFLMSGGRPLGRERYYVSSTKPIVVDDGIVYELSLSQALGGQSKTDRVVAFAGERIPGNNAVRLSVKDTSITFCGRSVPIQIIDGWEPSILPCELNGLLKILGCQPQVRGDLKSYRSLMAILQATGMSLCELCTLPDWLFENYRRQIVQSGGNHSIEDLLNRSHEVLMSGESGSNVLRCLLHRPRHIVIENQIQDRTNDRLGYLRLRNECIPFDRNPFSFNLYKNKTSGIDVIRCIDTEGRDADLLARRVIATCEQERWIYVAEDEFSDVEHLDELIQEYNDSLYRTHGHRKMVHESGQVFVRGYEGDISFILEKLLDLSHSGIDGYSDSSKLWLSANPGQIDDPMKESALVAAFDSTNVACIYGSAGTGKTTLVKYICSVMQGVRIVAIANTNPAVESLRRRVGVAGCDYHTVTKHLLQDCQCDLLIIDECSTVSNADMRLILERGGFSALLLVGDTRQIESIDFGNWFELASAFLPSKCLHELKKPWRTTSDSLVKLWNSVREIASDITEVLESNDMSCDIDDSLFKPACDDEVVLCLSYDGLYGINNVNLILQSQRSGPIFKWGMHRYKVGDPILFNDSNRFSPLLYNNLKGTLVGISQQGNDSIAFDVAVALPINALSVSAYPGLEYLGYANGLAVLRFTVSSVDDQDGESSADNVVPFQVAYAVSIHKAQGLEYDSVKLVVTKDTEKMISHNIFYTAITRAKKHLKIYWTAETETCVIGELAHSDSNRDACIISNRLGYQMHPSN